ncbi:MAG TPA: hypothetical protein VL092_03435, partial [Chitinophagaceae bacterium]|nr:hypothetical protein [Chitinophagaceae bacterium]
MKRLKLLSALLACTLTGTAQTNDSTVCSNISTHILTKGKCYEDLRVLCKKIGNRISGSKQAEWAVEWGEKTLREAGC